MIGCRACQEISSGDCGMHGPITVTSGVTLSTDPPPRGVCLHCGARLLKAGEKHAIVHPPRPARPFYLDIDPPRPARPFYLDIE